MDKLKILGKTEQIGKKIVAIFSKILVKQNTAKLFCFTASFVLCAAKTGGEMSPFALAFAAGCKTHPIFATAGAIFGYLFIHGYSALVYIAATLICFAAGFAFKNSEIKEVQLMMPITSTISLICVKSALVLGQGLLPIILLLCEGAICLTVCALFAQPRNERVATHWNAVAIVCVLSVLLFPITLPGGMSIGRLVAALAGIVFAYLGGSTLGAVSGIILGACVDLSGASGPFFSATYGVSALIAGFFTRSNKVAAVLTWFSANLLATLWGIGNSLALVGLFEGFIAAVVFFMLPDQTLLKLSSIFERPKVPQSAVGINPASTVEHKLKDISLAVEQLGVAMHTALLPKQTNDGDIAKIFDRAADEVCRNCTRASSCWGNDYVSTFGVLSDTTTVLKHNHTLTVKDFPQHFIAKCIALPKLCTAINGEYKGYLRRRAAAKSEQGTHSLMRLQYSGIQGVLRDIATAVSGRPEHFPALELRVKNIVKAYASKAKVLVYSENGRMHTEINISVADSKLWDHDAFKNSLTLALGRKFLAPKSLKQGESVTYKYSQSEAYCVKIGHAAVQKKGEQQCGDSGMSLHTDDGRAIILLSDGMGSGKSASEASKRALELISGFVRSGCSLIESTRAVLPVLNARFEQWGFVTLDLLEIDLFTGNGEFVKYGAAPSFLLRDGKIRKISVDSLPAGIQLQSEQENRTVSLKFKSGDRVLLMSDGAWDDSADERFLKEISTLPTVEMAKKIVNRAIDSGGHDDISLMTVSFYKASE